VIIVIAERRGALTSRESDGLTALVAVGLAFFMILSKFPLDEGGQAAIHGKYNLALQPTEHETERSRRRTRVWYVVVLCAFSDRHCPHRVGTRKRADRRHLSR